MKIQTTARIEVFAVNGKQQDLPDNQTIDFEFSAIDTGGGFKDPILDFSFTIPKKGVDMDGEGRSEITLTISDPNESNNHVSFSCGSEPQTIEGELYEINGRLKEEQLSKELIGFVFKLLR